MLARPKNTVKNDIIDIDGLATELEELHPRRIIAKALELYGDDIAISFSGAEDVVLLEYAHQLKQPFRVFTLDTGRLHPETYRLFAEVERRYNLRVEAVFPATDGLETLVQTKGMFSFYSDGHQECCGIRKVEPLKRKLKTLKAWITGQRRDQNPASRAEVPIVQHDTSFAGQDSGPLIKFNPLSHRTSAQVWEDIRAFDAPYNALHRQGFISIGCEPCTRPTLPGQHERDGRWWWESVDKKECGLHNINIKSR